MSDFRVASRYAKSLLDLAIENKSLEDTHKDIRMIDDVCKENRDLKTMLQSPVISSDRKFKVLELIFGKKVQKLTLSFIKIMAAKGRERLLPMITKEFHFQYLAYHGISEGVAITAVPVKGDLSKEFQNLAEKSFEGKVELSYVVNDNMIGGFILKSGDKQIDQSLRGKLNDLKKRFLVSA